MKSKIMQSLRNATLGLALLVGGCTATESATYYGPDVIIYHIKRPEFNGTQESGKKIYESFERGPPFGAYKLNTNEMKFLIEFSRKSEVEQKEELKKQGLSNFPFLNLQKPDEREIIFLYYFQKAKTK